jgi:hypothetical protein
MAKLLEATLKKACARPRCSVGDLTRRAESANSARMSPVPAPQKSMADLAAEYGLKPAEYQVILDRLGREPN